jgi:Fe2+ transport system protein FeoA
MTLLDLHRDEIAEIRKLPANAALARRIHALGLFTGRRVRFIRAAPLSGPVMIEDQDSGARLMIARNTAEQIEVRHDRSTKAR